MMLDPLYLLPKIVTEGLTSERSRKRSFKNFCDTELLNMLCDVIKEVVTWKVM